MTNLTAGYDLNSRYVHVRDQIAKTPLMETERNKDHLYFDLAFELAYWIHANKEVAFFVAEDALDELPLMLGRQENNRKSFGPLSGFWKGGERTRPIRQTIKLNERQMLQWLVYKQSEYWERQTESGEGLYLPTEEDMILRYLEHLVFTTLRRGSFYVSLAVAQLLHQFDRRETRLFYDILTQSDSARLKDMGYIGKQRLELLGRICRRFDGMIETVKTPGGEKQIVARPTDRRVVDFVHDCLERFTPWDTSCIVESGFDVTDIPGLYFSGPENDEDSVEMDRIHTVIDPACFARFVTGLCKYTRALPVDHQDKSCKYDSPDEQLAIPEFSNVHGGTSRGDRCDPPTLAMVDYIRLRRTLDARARRRRSFTPAQLSVYLDGRPFQSFDLSRTTRTEFRIGPEVGVIEVRGTDDQGELALATLLVEVDRAFRDSIVHPGGQSIEIQLTPIRDSDGQIEGTQVDVSYDRRRLIWPISRLAKRRSEGSERGWSGYRWVSVGAPLVLVFAALILVWFLLRPSQDVVKHHEQVQQAPDGDTETLPSIPTPVPPKRLPPSSKDARTIARASWSTDPETALRAVSIEPTRGEVKTFDLSRRQTQVFLSLPLYENDYRYSRYRVLLVAEGKLLWQRTLRAPANSLTGNAHILNLVLFHGELSQSRLHDLQVEGWTKNGWQPIGHVLLKPIER